MKSIVSSYYLKPNFGVRQKSFWRKARVDVLSDGTKVLSSYDTDICELHTDGTLVRLWDSCSKTSQRHIQAFTGLSKKEYEDATYKSLYRLKQSTYYIGGGQYQTIVEDIEL